MKTEDLEELLEAGRETPELDYKDSCSWDTASFAKDILAMSNLVDGGYIVIGVEELSDNTFKRSGICLEHEQTYKIDTMKDQMTAFADPHVNFSVEYPKDREDRTYAVIKVYPFKEIPVICKKDLHDQKGKPLTVKGTLYFRNSNKRAESAAISNSYDLRTIIERAAFMKMRALHSGINSAGLLIKSKNSVADILDQEIKNTARVPILDTIESRGHWRINFRPATLDNPIEKLADCLMIVQKNKLSLRGWSYPYVPNQNMDQKTSINPKNTHYQGWVISPPHIELWEMFLSTQFIQYRSLWEDWEQEDSLIAFAKRSPRAPGSYLSVLGTVYQITEIYEFLKRLVQDNLYANGVWIKIELCNTKERTLERDDPSHTPFFQKYKTTESIIHYEKFHEKEDVLLRSQELALDCMSHLFDVFGWHKANKQALNEDQKKLLAKRI